MQPAILRENEHRSCDGLRMLSDCSFLVHFAKLLVSAMLHRPPAAAAFTFACSLILTLGTISMSAALRRPNSTAIRVHRRPVLAHGSFARKKDIESLYVVRRGLIGQVDLLHTDRDGQISLDLCLWVVCGSFSSLRNVFPETPMRERKMFISSQKREIVDKQKIKCKTNLNIAELNGTRNPEWWGGFSQLHIQIKQKS